MNDVPMTSMLVPTPKSVALSELEASTLAVLVARVDSEVEGVPISKTGLLSIFYGVLQFTVGAFMIARNGLLPGALLLCGAVVQFSLMAHNSIAGRRARRDALPELIPEDADRLFRVVKAARKAAMAPAARSTALASLTPRRDLLLRDVERRLGLPVSSVNE